MCYLRVCAHNPAQPRTTPQKLDFASILTPAQAPKHWFSLMCTNFQRFSLILMRSSLVFINFHNCSLIFIYFLRCSLISVDFCWFPFISIDFHWCLLIFIDFHRFPWIFINCHVVSAFSSMFMDFSLMVNDLHWF